MFVSHAHSDHIAPHPETIGTEPTAWLMRHRLGGKRTERLLRFGEPLELQHGQKPFQITALPAGHILGSAMAWIEAGGQFAGGQERLTVGLAEAQARTGNTQ